MRPSEIIAQKANEQAQAVFEVGRIAMDAGNLQLAKDKFEEALAVHAHNFDAVHFLGIVYARAGRMQQALPYFKQALQLNPNMSAVHHNLGLTLDGLERLDEAMACFDRAIELNPDYEQAKLSRQATLARINATQKT
jgi:protein O-GlcNAc transferase